MSASISKSAFLRGVLLILPFLVLILPFGMLYGVIAREAGLPLSMIMGFSFFLVAGASQFAALQQMLDGAPIPIVLAAALTVNLRMAMYSAAMIPHFGDAPLWQRLLIAFFNFDQSYAYSTLKFETEPQMTLPQRVGYFLGIGVPVALCWYVGTAVGALVGASLPDAVPLDFALPIMFIAVVAPMVRTRAHLAAVVVSVAGGLVFAGLPWGAGLLVAAALALLAGALTEIRAERTS